MALPPAQGRLLVATRVIGDPNFEATVILLLEHEDDLGSLGVVLNRPTDLTLDDVLPGWEGLAAEPRRLFIGGPVAEGAAIALGELAPNAPPGGWTPVLDDLGVVDLERDPTAMRAAVRRLRVFSGYAGWGPRQLRGELDAGAWWVVDAAPDDPFTAEPADLWRRVLARQGGAWHMWANAPDDPSVN